MRTLNIVALCLIVVALFTGCQSTPTSRDYSPAIKTAAYVGTFYALKEHPEWRPSFELAAVELNTLASADQIDIATIMAIVTRLPVDQLQSDEAVVIITSATLLLAEYGGGGRPIPLEQLQSLKPVAVALRDGINLGLR
jgi:uncharacterized protein YceK